MYIIGYSPLHKRYKCLHASGQVYVAKYIVFYELTFTCATESAFHSHSKSDPYPSLSITSQQVYHLSTLPIIRILLVIIWCMFCGA